ncbi:hypothetical protein [Microvirga arsenatis]|uniref:Anti-sigma factor NepR domain-containing protein n=1 Tax=Microvirga arsenatis TaxID=2692265 RepID=A0ABW9Z335_9HYPH|nr:hypothetical protein [Microvirga arsenatis]NBJ13034.1 hypothetical protein [Microvirga arsenatis]NBJ26743.1 hypothetical protein [Microvirga arsenatis]
MLADDEQIRGLRLPNTLELPPSQTAAGIGHLLQGIYADILKEAYPRQLMALVEKLDDAERMSVRSSQR